MTTLPAAATARGIRWVFARRSSGLIRARTLARCVLLGHQLAKEDLVNRDHPHRRSSGTCCLASSRPEPSQAGSEALPFSTCSRSASSRLSSTEPHQSAPRLPRVREFRSVLLEFHMGRDAPGGSTWPSAPLRTVMRFTTRWCRPTFWASLRGCSSNRPDMPLRRRRVPMIAP